jgi:hypothetical protein
LGKIWKLSAESTKNAVRLRLNPRKYIHSGRPEPPVNRRPIIADYFATFFTVAQRFFCASAIFFLASALKVRRFGLAFLTPFTEIYHQSRSVSGDMGVCQNESHSLHRLLSDQSDFGKVYEKRALASIC